ncbi:MAG: PAS domain S-box protein [Desulfobaccales bacterium]
MDSAPVMSEEWLRLLLNETPTPVMVLDRDQRLIANSQGAARLFGDRLRLGKPFSLGEGDAFGVYCHRALNQGESFEDLPFLVEDHAGTPFPLIVNLSPIGRPQEPPQGCLLVCRKGRMDFLARRAMQIQEATLNSILENFPTPFFMVDQDLTVTYLNKCMEEFTGFSRDAVVGRMTCGALLKTAQCNTADCVLRLVMQQQSPVSGLRRVIQDIHGRDMHVVLSASLITDQTGQVVGGFEAIQDITPMVEAEKKIDMLAELAKDGIIILDEELRVSFANTQMAGIVKAPKEKLIGQDIGEVLSSQHHRMASDILKGGAWQEKHFISTLDPTEPGGDRRVFETWMEASQVGKSVFIYVYMHDLTNRIRVGRELHKAHNFLQEIIRCSVDGIVVVDAKGIPLIFNEGAQRILGFRPEEVIGHPEVLFKFYPPEVAREMKRLMISEKYGPPDKLPTTQVNFVNKSGEEIPVKFSAAIIRSGGKEVASVGIFSDLREYLKLRQDLEESQTQLVQAQKISSMGRLASGVAHEINNPLAGILIYAELLQRELAPETQGKEFVGEIIHQTLRCQQIVQRLLEFSRQSLGQRTMFDLNYIVHRCVELISHQALFHDITLKQELDPELPHLMGDPGQIQQVLTNLLINAADAMEGQGTISISTQTNPDRSGIVLTFADTGCGIPESQKDKIFEPFFTTKPVGKGTGLGLSIVYGVIQRHGGEIEVDSEPGVGTTFTISLPLDFQMAGNDPFTMN